MGSTWARDKNIVTRFVQSAPVGSLIENPELLPDELINTNRFETSHSAMPSIAEPSGLTALITFTLPASDSTITSPSIWRMIPRSSDPRRRYASR